MDILISVPDRATAAVQECHIVIEHALCRAVEHWLLAAPYQHVTPGSIVSLQTLLTLRQEWATAGCRLVWTNGCFDLIHAGHLASLEAARALGDVLVVGVNEDAAVRRLKGEGRPLMPAADRAALLAALRPVDYVVVFEGDTPEAILAELRPDIHCKGADYAGVNGKPVPERAVVESYGGRVEFLPLIDGRSTTSLVRALRGEET